MQIHRDIAAYSVDPHVFFHLNGGHVYRKGWEWTQCVYALERVGALEPAHKALGVGAGREALIFYFADRLSSVVALDLYGNAQWTNEANADIVKHPERWTAKRARFDHIQFVTGSGTQLKFDAGAFDFCWSLSSIEHFGGHDAAACSMREMARVTRPGGYIALATEYLLLPDYEHAEYFNREQLDRHIIHASKDLELVSPIDLNTLPPEFLIDSVVIPQGQTRIRRHVVLNDGAVQWTSIFLLFRRT